MATRSTLLVGGVAAGMVALAALAGARAALLPDTASAVRAPGGLRLTLASTQYGPVPTQFDPTPLGLGQVPVPEAPNTALARRPPATFGVYTAPATGAPAGPTPATAQVIPAVNLGADGLDCRLDQVGRRAAVPVDTLVKVINTGIGSLGAQPPVEAIRELVQSDLNRSGEDPKLKTEALAVLKASAPSGSLEAQALAKPFDLYDNAVVNVPGYDPCGNPAAIGGSAFGSGPFASDFATINPVPVVASRLAAAVEGGT